MYFTLILIRPQKGKPHYDMPHIGYYIRQITRDWLATKKAYKFLLNKIG